MEARPNINQRSRVSGRKRQQLFSADIVFTAKNGSIQSVPALNKRLKSVGEAIVGLQYIWEYRSPSKAVPPHYQCKLCKVNRLQNEITSHITGWKHNFRYLKQNHKDKVPQEEEDALKDPAIRKAIKMVAAEVERTEGRGQIKVVLREPCEIVAFQDMKSARPNPALQGPGGVRGPQPRQLNVGPLGGPMFMPPQGGNLPQMSDFHDNMDSPPMRRGYPIKEFISPVRYGNGGPDRDMMEMERMHHYPEDGHMGPDDFGPSQRNQGRPMDSLMGHGPKGPENNSIPATLLKYLDSFRIDNEDDAQIVLKVTQKLTDALMEYRLRSNLSVPSVKPLPPMKPLSSSYFPHTSDRFSDSMPGPSRYYN